MIVTEAPADIVIDRDAQVYVRDGTVLRVNVFGVPDQGPVPAILSIHPYGKDKLPTRRGTRWTFPMQYRVTRQPEPVRFSDLTGWEAPDPAWWVKQGFAVVNADLRGCGHSEDASVVGEVNKGWDVAGRLLFHERRAVGQGSEFASRRGRERSEDSYADYFALAEVAGRSDDPLAQDKIGRVLARRMVRDCLVDHVAGAMRDGTLPPAAGSIIRLFHSDVTFLQVDTAMEIAGPLGVVDSDHELLKVGERYLSRQTVALGGGSDEMARNVIRERVLGLPREYAADRGVPFNQVRHNKAR